MPTGHHTSRPLSGPRHLRPATGSRRRTRAALRLTAASVVVAMATFSVVALRAPEAGANPDVVTNCEAAGAGSLPQAVSAAHAGDTIDFSLSCPVITLIAPLLIDTNLTIDGPGASALAVSGGNLVQVLDVPAGITATVSGLTIEDGTTPAGDNGTTGTSTGTGDGGTGINGGGGGGVFNAGTLTLSDDTVSNNTTAKGGNGGNGGTNTGLDDLGGTGGSGGGGAGIFNAGGGTLTLTDDTVSDNRTGPGGNGGVGGASANGTGGTGGAGGVGAGIDNAGTLVMTGTMVEANTTGVGGNGGNANPNAAGGAGAGGPGGGGAGIFNAGGGTVTTTGDTVSGNTTGGGGNGGGSQGDSNGGNGGSGGGGGGIDSAGILQVTNDTLSGNDTGAGGAGGTGEGGGGGGNGGNGAGMDNAGPFSLTATTVSGNNTGAGGAGGSGAFAGGGGGASGSGAGIANAPSSSVFTNDTVSGNTTGAGGAGGTSSFGPGGGGGNSGGGGGLDNAGNVVLNNDTVAGNSIGQGGFAGLPRVGRGSSGAGSGLLAGGGSLVLSATIVADSAPGNDCSGPVDDNGFNIDDDISCNFTAASSTNHSPTLDGSLGSLKNNGGPTQTMALTGGPAVDVVAGAACPPTDQRGAPRTAPCDIGAYDSDFGPFIARLMVTVSGSQSFDSTTPVFTETSNAPAGVASGTITCTTVNGGTTIGSGLAFGSYTIDGSSCTGLTSTDPTDYPIFGDPYTGAPNGFVVSADTTSLSLTALPSPVEFGHEHTTVFTVTLLTENGEELAASENVTVAVGSTSCPVTLAPATGGGSGSCSIADSALIGGSYTASVSYPGDTDLQGSGPADATFVVSLVLTAPPLPNPVYNAPYTATISTGASGTAPVSFTESGALPDGVTLLSAGAFSGTPTNPAQIETSFPITVHATDADSATGSQAYTLTLQTSCGAGLTTHVLVATSHSGNFTGIFCVNAAGTGTYTQGTVHGTGTVTTSSGATRVTAVGTGLALLGQKTSRSSTFIETAPPPAKAGTFTLT